MKNTIRILAAEHKGGCNKIVQKASNELFHLCNIRDRVAILPSSGRPEARVLDGVLTAIAFLCRQFGAGSRRRPKSSSSKVMSVRRSIKRPLKSLSIIFLRKTDCPSTTDNSYIGVTTSALLSAATMSSSTSCKLDEHASIFLCNSRLTERIALCASICCSCRPWDSSHHALSPKPKATLSRVGTVGNTDLNDDAARDFQTNDKALLAFSLNLLNLFLRLPFQLKARFAASLAGSVLFGSGGNSVIFACSHSACLCSGRSQRSCAYRRFLI
jgi:hypothetical protein